MGILRRGPPALVANTPGAMAHTPAPNGEDNINRGMAAPPTLAEHTMWESRTGSAWICSGPSGIPLGRQAVPSGDFFPDALPAAYLLPLLLFLAIAII